MKVPLVVGLGSRFALVSLLPALLLSSGTAAALLGAGCTFAPQRIGANSTKTNNISGAGSYWPPTLPARST